MHPTHPPFTGCSTLGAATQRKLPDWDRWRENGKTGPAEIPFLEGREEKVQNQVIFSFFINHYNNHQHHQLPLHVAVFDAIVRAPFGPLNSLETHLTVTATPGSTFIQNSNIK